MQDSEEPKIKIHLKLIAVEHWSESSSRRHDDLHCDTFVPITFTILPSGYIRKPYKQHHMSSEVQTEFIL